MAFAHWSGKLDWKPWLLASAVTFATKLSDNHVNSLSPPSFSKGLEHISLLSLRFM